MDQTRLILLLLDTPGIGPQALGAVLRRNAVAGRDPDAFLALPVDTLREEYGIRSQVARALLEQLPMCASAAEEDARLLQRCGVTLTTVLDGSYPSRLTDRMDDPPPALFLYGNAELLTRPLFAVAQSNGASEAALAAGDRAAEETLAAGWSLVTGHNRVGYQRPALAVRRNSGRICYVLDRGLLQGFGNNLQRALFPAARIWGPAYDPQCDLTISPFGLRAHGIAANNRRRDTLVFTLADVLFVGEARAGGQMERECMCALESGRPVYLLREEDRDGTLAAAGAQYLPQDRIRPILESHPFRT